jgi:ubiquinone/menaquinone biosynthesis C-methylase UbiE
VKTVVAGSRRGTRGSSGEHIRNRKRALTMIHRKASALPDLLAKIQRRVTGIAARIVKAAPYDFDKSNPLGSNGERVDIQLDHRIRFEKLDIYQKSHWKRYKFALSLVEAGDVCGDFACGTGYGSVMLSEKARAVVGVDIDAHVIDAIRRRYKKNEKVTFVRESILDLTFVDHFDKIISFETIEHFQKDDIMKLLAIFGRALKRNGRLILSTPFMQEEDGAAARLAFHQTFGIHEGTLRSWLGNAGFQIELLKYQNYETHTLGDDQAKKDFIICVASKHV